MLNLALIYFGKMLSFVFRILNLGNGSTWPGHIALSVNNHFIKDCIKKTNMNVIIVAGTNGKTTTSKMLRTILEGGGNSIIQNQSGANLLNGIASALILSANGFGKLNSNFALFEIDENALPLLLKELVPDYLILLNLFRDQLDRYGEVNTIARKWKESIEKLPSNKTTIIANADDPEIAFLGQTKNTQTYYFGLDDSAPIRKTHEHAVDSVYCPRCGTRLAYKKFFFSHLGVWTCTECGLKHPANDQETYSYYPLDGVYNRYNTLAAVLASKAIGLDEKIIQNGLKKFSPAFGRQEEIALKGNYIKLFLSKNPTGFNESLRTIHQLGAKTILIVLNDRIADGRDVSWIWDMDIEEFVDDFSKILVSGDRVFDMGLRIKYAMVDDTASEKLSLYENLNDAIRHGINLLKPDEVLYILPTYTAMLEVRKILKGRKIL